MRRDLQKRLGPLNVGLQKRLGLNANVEGKRKQSFRGNPLTGI